MKYKYKFDKCCGRKPRVILWDRQQSECGIWDNNAGVNVQCKKCGAELTVRGVIETDEEMQGIIALAEKEWNGGKKTILPFEITATFKAGTKL
jgi:hypothetical protein